MAMAAFATYIGRPIEMNGLIFTQWYLNQGMPDVGYHKILSIMPGFGQLEQGAKVSGKQFSLNYNTDFRSIIGSFMTFHGSLTVVTFATDGDDFINPLAKSIKNSRVLERAGSQLTMPGLPNLEFLSQYR